MDREGLRRYLIARRGMGELVEVEPLEGGLLNRVWRVRSETGTMVAKHAPGALSVAPEVRLGPERLRFEARALRFLEGDPLGMDGTVRAPRLVDLDEEVWVLLMEDLGPGPDLERRLRAGEASPEAFAALGTFVARLHGETAGDAGLAARFDNRDVQRTRRQVQYEAIEGLCERAGVRRAADAGRAARDLGARYLEPGVCLTMGDLWPRSIMEQAGSLGVIDWELAHYGRPSQDVGHLMAHLFMHAHRARTTVGRDGALAATDAFMRAYLAEVPARLHTAAEARDAEVHAGSEIVARVLGPFRKGYLYDGVARDVIDEAITHGMGLILSERRPG